MTCRAPSGSTTCAGTQTGAQLGYNNEGELQSWQNAPSSPTTTDSFLYDGQGQRVAQSVTQSGTTASTVYVGDVEELSTTGGSTTTTAYYYAGGKRIGLSVGGAISYLASDGLGSAAVTLSSSGSATASQLYAPYGGVRYSSGTMPTPYGFTGQRSDATTGVDYYGARYYDPVAGQFTSADSVVPGGGFDPWGLSRYAYVEGNPIIRLDPTGHSNQTDGYGGDPGGGGGDPSCPDTCVPSGTTDPSYTPTNTQDQTQPPSTSSGPPQGNVNGSSPIGSPPPDAGPALNAGLPGTFGAAADASSDDNPAKKIPPFVCQVMPSVCLGLNQDDGQNAEQAQPILGPCSTGGGLSCSIGTTWNDLYGGRSRPSVDPSAIAKLLAIIAAGMTLAEVAAFARGDRQEVDAAARRNGIRDRRGFGRFS
jgi:RHS repeat-associated protein